MLAEDAVIDRDVLATFAIQDHYLHNTRLRVRSVQDAGGRAVRKLGQKIRLDRTSASAIAHTTMYLSEDEYRALLALPADELSKIRHLLPADDRTVAVDIFGGVLTGLVVAELELGEDETGRFELPVDSVADVSDDERFTGARLARTDRDGLRNLLFDYGLGAGPAPS